MKRLVLTLLLCLWASSAQAAITPLTHTSKGSTNAGTSVVTTAIDTTGATLIVVLASDYAAGAGQPTLTDSAGNSWTALTVRDSGTGGRAKFYYVVNPTTNAAHTFTLTLAGSYPALAVASFAGTHASSPFDQESGATGSSVTSKQPGSLTPSGNNYLVITGLSYTVGEIGAVAVTQMTGAPTPLEDADAVAGQNCGVSLAYEIQTTATARNPTWSWTNSDNVAVALAVFKDAGAVTSRPVLIGGGVF